MRPWGREYAQLEEAWPSILILERERARRLQLLRRDADRDGDSPGLLVGATRDGETGEQVEQHAAGLWAVELPEARRQCWGTKMSGRREMESM